MKRIVSFILVVLLVMSVAITDTYAMDRKHKSFHQENVKKFKDIDKYGWAERSIEKMAIKGVIQGDGSGSFNPSKAVTKIEAIIMALRVMGYEEEARISLDKIKKGSKKLKNKNSIQQWAYGYVSVAIEKGILDEVDLIDMNLRAPAQRHEVAKYIIRALGYEKEAQRHMKKDLKFIDAGAVPVGSVGYVYLADKKGIIKGYEDKTFRPNRPVTRAEMAVLIARIDDMIDNNIDENEELVEIIKWRDNKLTVKINNRTVVYKILKNTPVYTEEGKYVSVGELKAGMKVKIQLNDKKTIIFIEIKEYKEVFKEYVGYVEEIDNDEIEIKINGRVKEFDIDDDATVQFSNKKGDVDDIKEGDKVKVKVDGGDEIEYIRVYRQLDLKEYQGVVEDIDEDEIEIKVNRVIFEFDIEDDADIKFNNREGDLEDIKDGDKVRIRLDNNKDVEYIRVYRNLSQREYKGEVEDIDDDEITIEVNNTDMTFDIERDVEVEFNDEEGEVEDIEEGDEVKIRVDSNKDVEYIRVYRKLDGREYEGEVEDIDDDEITIEVNNTDMTFDIERDVEVEFKNGYGILDDIKEGDDVKVRIDSDKDVEYIKVYRNLDYDVYEGFFLEADDNELSIIDSQKVIEFKVDLDVKVKFTDKSGGLENLIVGDVIKVVTLEDDDEIRWIKVDRKYNATAITGTLTDLYGDEKQIAIKQNGKIKIYEYKSTVKVYINDSEKKLSDLDDGDNLYLVLEDNKVKEIRVYRLGDDD